MADYIYRTPESIDAEQVAEFDYPLAGRWTVGDVTATLMFDEGPEAPWENDEFFPHCAIVALNERRVDYTLNADPIRDLEIECPHCEGLGYIIDSQQDHVDCKHCVGEGYQTADDVEQYVKVERGAVAALSIDYGDYGAADAVLYWTAEQVTEMGAPADSLDDQLKASARELRDWAEGNVFGYIIEWPGGEESVWGFVGQDYALDALTEQMEWALTEARTEQDERAHWEARDTITTGGKTA